MNKHYIENEQKRATTCIITNHPTVTDKLMKRGATISSIMAIGNRNRTNASKFIGVARRHKLDTPDAPTGRRISSSKADLAYHKAMANDLKDIKKQLLKEIVIIETLELHELKMIDKTEEFIEFLKK